MTFLAQLGQFKVSSALDAAWISGSELYIMLALIAVTMLIIYMLPKLTKAIPSSLAGILIVTGIVTMGGLSTKLAGDMASIKGGLPIFSIPQIPFSIETLKIIFLYSLILAGIGLIESLLTLTLVDELTETKSSANKECVAQRAANIVTVFFEAWVDMR